jgi:hypothetical protein
VRIGLDVPGATPLWHAPEYFRIQLARSPHEFLRSVNGVQEGFKERYESHEARSSDRDLRPGALRCFPDAHVVRNRLRGKRVKKITMLLFVRRTSTTMRDISRGMILENDISKRRANRRVLRKRFTTLGLSLTLDRHEIASARRLPLM